MTMTRLDLLWRGLVRGFSTDMVRCHSCFLAYDNVYKLVVLVEELYVEWNLETTSSFAIFSKITDSYGYMADVERLCSYKEFWAALKLRAVSFDLWLPTLKTRILQNMKQNLRWLAILWYSLNWSTMEDTGIALGYFTSLVFNLHLEDVVPNRANDATWDCSVWAPYSYFSEITDKEFSVKQFWN